MVDFKQIRIRRDTWANWSAANPVLEAGEPAVVIDVGNSHHGEHRTGDGVTKFLSLRLDDQKSIDAVAGKYTKPQTGIPDADFASPPVHTVNGIKPGPGGDVVINTEGAAKQALVGVPMVGMGHSFIVGSNIQSPNKWAEQLAAAFGMTYPTLATTGDLMRAVAGSRVEEAAQRILSSSTLKWNPGDPYPALIQALINTARKNGADANTKAGALNSLRTMCAMISSAAAVPATSTRFTYSSGWAATAVSTSLSGNVQTIASGGASTVNVTFTMPASVVYLLFLARPGGTAGHRIVVKNSNTGATLVSFDNVNQCSADTPNTYAPLVLRVAAAVGDTIAITRDTTPGTGPLSFDGFIVPSASPPPIMLMKEPYLANYSLSTDYPNGSDAVLDYFNDVIDTMAKEFGNVIVANPNTAGYWDKTTMIQSDGTHPNDAGSAALANTMRDAVNAQLPRNLARRALGLARL